VDELRPTTNREEAMTAGMQKTLIIAAAAALFIIHAGAQTAAISDDVVKIGVLTDMSGQFSHESGEGSGYRC
jgi:branched-chain amino acid transport system substrate-binding protein